MNVCAFLGGKTTEHESSQLKEMPDKEQNIEKKKVSVIFWTFEKIFLKST